MTPKRPATRLDFEIAIICALVIEADAVRGLFDHDWDDDGPPYDKAPGDPNAYSTGLLGRHNVVLAHMPGMGKANAASVAANCRNSFPNIRLALVVGVCGAVPIVPSTKTEIILGDVIMSSGVIQYDFGRRLPERFMRKDTLLDSLGRPNTEIRALLAKLGGIHVPREYALAFSLSEVTEVARFVGRKDELAKLHSVLTNANGRRTAVVHGLGGMGKTQLTIAYLKSYHAKYSANIWLNASDEISLQESFSRAAKKILRQYPDLVSMKTAIDSRDSHKVVQAVIRWLDKPDNNRWLLVFDNYDNPKLQKEEQSDNVDQSINLLADEQPAQESILASKAYDIRAFFPDNYQGAIIITTRSSAVTIGKSIFLKKFTEVSESLEVLQSNSRRDDIENDDAAIKLAKRLEGLPLALATAGAYLSQVTTSCTEYLTQYEASWLRLQENTPRLLSYEDRAMYSTWNVSYTQIKQRSHAAAMILHLWAYFDHEDLWYELLRYEGEEVPFWFKNIVQDHLSFHQVMRILCSHGLVEAERKEWGIDSRGYSVHACVHAWMKHALNKKHERGMAQLAIRCVASRIPDQGQDNYWLVQRRLLLHVDICSSYLMEFDQQGDGNHEWIGHMLGLLYADQGRHKDAEAMYQRALQGKEKAWGPEHTSTLDTVNNLGSLYADQGRHKDAEAMYQRALQGYEQAMGSTVNTYPPALDTIQNLGSLFYCLNRLEEAENHYSRAQSGLAIVYGHDSERYNDVFLLLTKMRHKEQPKLGRRRWLVAALIPDRWKSKRL